MDLTPEEQPVVRRAVAEYHEMKKRHKGSFTGTTATEILEELKPSLVRWTELAAFVIEGQKDPHEAIDNVARQLTPLVGIVVRPQNRDPLGGAGEPVRCHP